MNALLILAAAVAVLVLYLRDRDELSVRAPDLSALATEVRQVKARAVELDRVTRDVEASTHDVGFGVVEAARVAEDNYQ